jgi:putative membrane protein
MKTRITILVALGCLSAFAGAQEVGFYTDGRPERIFKPVTGLDQIDVKFLRQAAIINRFEIEAAKIAQANGSSDFVKDYSKDMLADHTAGLAEDVQTAENKQVTLSQNMPANLQAKLNHLGNLKGDAFDQAYRATQINGHRDATAVFQKEIENGHDDLVKAYAVKMLPNIELHMRLAIAKQSETGTNTKANHGI